MATPHAQEKHRTRKRIAVTLLHHRRPKRKHVSLPRVAPLPLEHAPPGIHDVVPLPGPVPAHVAQQLRSNAPAWAIACLKCNKRVQGTGRWLKFIHSACPAPAADLRRVYGVHELIRAPVGWTCRRCGLPVSSARRAAAARSKCAIPTVFLGPERQYEAERWLSRQQRLPTEWKTSHCQPTPADLRRQQRQQPALAPHPPLSAAPAAVALRWKNHLAIQHNGHKHWVCMSCGVRRGSFARLLSLPCAGWQPKLPKALLLAVRAGAFDSSLGAASRPVRIAAEARGWRPIAPPDVVAPAFCSPSGVSSGALAQESAAATHTPLQFPAEASRGGVGSLEHSVQSTGGRLDALMPSGGGVAPACVPPAATASNGVGGGDPRTQAKRPAPAEPLGVSAKRVRLAHGARIQLALAGGALSDAPVANSEVGPLGQQRGLKRVSFCPVVEIEHFEPPGYGEFPLARRRRGQPTLVASSGATAEHAVMSELVLDAAAASALASSTASPPTSTESCMLSPPVANLQVSVAPGQCPRRPAEGGAHCVVPAPATRQPPAAAPLPPGTPPGSGAPAHAHKATVAAQARTVAPASVVPARTALGRSGGAHARQPVSRVRAADGESTARPGHCRRQLTLADFWR